MIEVKKKEGESSSGALYRFTKRVKQSGILREARKRRFRGRVVSRQKRRLSAKYRAEKRREMERTKKLGHA